MLAKPKNMKWISKMFPIMNKQKTAQEAEMKHEKVHHEIRVIPVQHLVILSLVTMWTLVHLRSFFTVIGKWATNTVCEDFNHSSVLLGMQLCATLVTM